MDDGRRFLSPFPGNRDLMLIAVGLVVGVLLGPAVLGRLAPSVHRDLFGGVDRVSLLDQEREARADKAGKLEDIGVSKAYVEQQLRQVSVVYQARREAGRAQRFNRVASLSASLILALVVMMTLEAAISPQPRPSSTAPQVDPGKTQPIGRSEDDVAPQEDAQAGAEADPVEEGPAAAEVSPWVGRLISVRYGLIALWVALMLGSPVILLDLPWLFVAALLAVGLVLGLVPLGRTRGAHPQVRV